MTSGKKQVDVCLTSAPSSSFSSGTPLIRLRNAMHSRHEVERWYKEIEPIIKTAHSRSRRSTEGIERPPKFEINGPNDVESIECLRNYYKKRVNDQKQFLESINNRESQFTKHLLQHLCITDLNRKKIDELKEELNDVSCANVEIARKNDGYQREINALKAGQVKECKLKSVRAFHKESDREAHFNQRTEVMLNRQTKKLEKISNMAESAMSSTNVASLRRHFAGDERTRFEVIKPPYQQTSNRRLTSESNNDRREHRKISSDAEGDGTTTTCSSSGGSTAASSSAMLETFQSRRSKSMNTFAYPFHVNLPKPLIARALAVFNERNSPKTEN